MQFSRFIDLINQSKGNTKPPDIWRPISYQHSTPYKANDTSLPDHKSQTVLTIYACNMMKCCVVLLAVAVVVFSSPVMVERDLKCCHQVIITISLGAAHALWITVMTYRCHTYCWHLILFTLCHTHCQHLIISTLYHTHCWHLILFTLCHTHC